MSTSVYTSHADINRVFSHLSGESDFHLDANTTFGTVTANNDSFTIAMIFNEAEKLVMMTTPTQSITGSYDTIEEVIEVLDLVIAGEIL